MIDEKLIKNNSEIIKNNLKKRNSDSTIIDEIKELIINKNNLIIKNQKLLEEKNIISSKIGSLIQENKLEEVKSIKEKIANNKKIYINQTTKIKELKELIDNKISWLPNILKEEVPVGQDETQNKIIRYWGEKHDKSHMSHHYELLEKYNLVDFKRTSEISGSRFISYKNKGSLLKRSLINYLLDKNIMNGYKEIDMPILVKENIIYGTGQLPKFKDDVYKTKNGLYLISTGEITLTNYYKNKIFTNDELPIKLTSYSSCFRKESGAAGKDNRGIIRLHQFNKVELVKITKPENSSKELELMVNNVEEILQELRLSYRTILLCSGDTGFSSSKTYDIEVWMPKEKKYLEISSCSNCGTFQSKRINLKYKDENGKNNLCHTLNGSCLAIDRLIAAIVENYQVEDKIIIPEILKKYFRDKEIV